MVTLEQQVLPFDVRRRRRAMLALLRAFRWEPLEARARELAAGALEAALEVRAGRLRDARTRALVERAVRRLGLVAHLEE